MKDWLVRLKNCKKDQVLILLLVGMLLVVIALPTENGSSLSGTGETKTGTAEAVQDSAAGTEASDFESELEARLSRILSQVEGIGETRVMITLKSDGRRIVEKDTDQSEGKEASMLESESSSLEQSSSSESTVYEKAADGSESPFVAEELAPEIQGVLVIAQGADNSVTVTEITEAVMALFGVEAHKIKVMKME